MPVDRPGRGIWLWDLETPFQGPLLEKELAVGLLEAAYGVWLMRPEV